ncbi:MAG: hypothetical protein GZ088_09725 [Acidipila sp.]|nr:hypothetical protein [Acidipila sp.]
MGQPCKSWWFSAPTPAYVPPVTTVNDAQSFAPNVSVDRTPQPFQTGGAAPASMVSYGTGDSRGSGYTAAQVARINAATARRNARVHVRAPKYSGIFRNARAQAKNDALVAASYAAYPGLQEAMAAQLQAMMAPGAGHSYGMSGIRRSNSFVFRGLRGLGDSTYDPGSSSITAYVQPLRPNFTPTGIRPTTPAWLQPGIFTPPPIGQPGSYPGGVVAVNTPTGIKYLPPNLVPGVGPSSGPTSIDITTPGALPGTNVPPAQGVVQSVPGWTAADYANLAAQQQAAHNAAVAAGSGSGTDALQSAINAAVASKYTDITPIRIPYAPARPVYTPPVYQPPRAPAAIAPSYAYQPPPVTIPIAAAKPITPYVFVQPKPVAGSGGSPAPVPNVPYVDDSDFDTTVASGTTVVFFHGPHCGLCTQQMKNITTLTTQRRADGSQAYKVVEYYATENNANRAKFDQYGIRGYPNIMVFKNGVPQTWNDPTLVNPRVRAIGNHTFEQVKALVDQVAASDVSAPPPPPPPPPRQMPVYVPPPEQTAQAPSVGPTETGSGTQHATDRNFATMIGGSGVTTIVVFHARWCPHCPDFVRYANQVVSGQFTNGASYRNNGVMNGSVRIVDVDIDESPKVAAGVNSVPSLKMYKDGQFVTSDIQLPDFTKQYPPGTVTAPVAPIVELPDQPYAAGALFVKLLQAGKNTAALVSSGLGISKAETARKNADIEKFSLQYDKEMAARDAARVKVAAGPFARAYAAKRGGGPLELVDDSYQLAGAQAAKDLQTAITAALEIKRVSDAGHAPVIPGWSPRPGYPEIMPGNASPAVVTLPPGTGVPSLRTPPVGPYYGLTFNEAFPPGTFAVDKPFIPADKPSQTPAATAQFTPEEQAAVLNIYEKLKAAPAQVASVYTQAQQGQAQLAAALHAQALLVPPSSILKDYTTDDRVVNPDNYGGIPSYAKQALNDANRYADNFATAGKILQKLQQQTGASSDLGITVAQVMPLYFGAKKDYDSAITVEEKLDRSRRLAELGEKIYWAVDAEMKKGLYGNLK